MFLEVPYTKVLNDSNEFYSKNFINQNDYHKHVLVNNSTYSILHNIGIMIEMGIAQDAYFKPLYQETVFLLIMGFIVLLFGSFISYLLATKITNPILALFEKVNATSFEDISKEYQPLGTNDELEALGYAFYKKKIELVDLNKNLHKRVDEATKELEKEKNRFALAAEGSRDSLWDWNLQTGELFFSDRFEIVLGYEVGSLQRNIDTYFALMHPDDIQSVDKAVKEHLEIKDKDYYEASFRLRAKDGSWRWFLGRGKAEFKDAKPLRVVGFNTDITEQKEYQDKLDHTAKHDSLTKLPNRFLLSELLTHEMHIVKRNHKLLALLFIDLDGFKEVNDVYGHEAGDEVLSVVASRMNNIVRDSDIVSRLGGDEFVIVVTNLSKSEDLIPLLQNILKELSSSIKYNNQTMSVSASIGVSLYPQSIDIGNEALLRQADQAMYSAKSSGKNQYKFFDIEASDELKENLKNISSLKNAIKADELVLHYQPKIDMKNNRVIGLEALLRWNHPQKGLLYPNDFLPLIEQDSALMVELGSWVFENAFKELESWHLQGLDITLSINVSSHELQQYEFTTNLQKLFDKYKGIKPNTIDIEILETAAFSNFELTSETLKKCQELGVSVSVDDFGTGYASLHYLKKLPMNTLKIDKSFVIDLLHTSSSMSIVEASLGLAHAFSANVVAEGVESEEHGKILIQLGCNIAQGYIIARAMPAKDVVEWISSYKGFSSWSKVQPLEEDERKLLYTSIEHRGWMHCVESFIKNDNMDFPQLDKSKCYLGKWIKNNASKYLTNPNFVQLETLHTQLHSHTEKLLLLHKDDKSAELKKLKNLHQEIIEKFYLLTSLTKDKKDSNNLF